MERNLTKGLIGSGACFNPLLYSNFVTEVNRSRRIFLNIIVWEESDEEKPGVILDYDKDGNIVGLEILDASKRMENPRAVEYAVAS